MDYNGSMGKHCPMTIFEALAVADALDLWPGGWGFVLHPSRRSRRGFSPTGFHPRMLPRANVAFSPDHRL